MSGPKTVYVPPPPPAKITTSFSTSSHREQLEIMNILRGYTAVKVSYRNGVYVTEYETYEGRSYTNLRNAINEARKKAQDNMRYVDMFKVNETRVLDEALRNNEVICQKNIRLIDDEIRRLQSTLNEISNPLSTPYGDFSDNSEITKINKTIEKLNKDKAEILKKKKELENNIRTYRAKIDNAVTKDAVVHIASSKPVINLSNVNNEITVNTLLDEANKRHAVASKYAEQLVEVSKTMKQGELNKYDSRISERVAGLNPFDPDSLNIIKKLVEAILEEERALLAQKKSEQVNASAEAKAMHDLEVLKEISIRMSSEVVLMFDKDGVPDASKFNLELIDKIEESVASIQKLDYVSRENNEKISQILSLIEENKTNIGNSYFTDYLKQTIDELQMIMADAIKENEQFVEFSKELARYNSQLGILFPEDEEADIDNLSGLVFNPRRADETIALLKEKNQYLEKTINEIQSRAYVAAATEVLEEEGGRVFKKRQDQEQYSVDYISKSTPGMIYEIRTEGDKAQLYPRGVILHNGHKMIEADALKEAHHSCGWAKDLDKTMTNAGFPQFEMIEREDAIKDDIYKEEEYYRLETYEDSVRYLEMIGFSIDKIIELVGKKESVSSTSKEEQKELKKSIAIGDK